MPSTWRPCENLPLHLWASRTAVAEPQRKLRGASVLFSSLVQAAASREVLSGESLPGRRGFSQKESLLLLRAILGPSFPRAVPGMNGLDWELWSALPGSVLKTPEPTSAGFAPGSLGAHWGRRSSGLEEAEAAGVGSRGCWRREPPG